MSDNPLVAALARLHAKHPDLPVDGGRVWEPVQDDEAPPQPEQGAAPMKFTLTAEVRHLTGDLEDAPEVTGRSGDQLQSESVEIEYAWDQPGESNATVLGRVPGSERGELVQFPAWDRRAWPEWISDLVAEQAPEGWDA
ncbi:MAG: hypothetical protein JWO98_1438 [Frankiales bacterium]|nr:hypothetical protein [Frankiales bacterium]